MVRFRSIFLTGIFLCGLIRAVAADVDGVWEPTTWQGEKALVSTSHGWKAIVSLERGRLMHFGATKDDVNLFFAPPARSNSSSWGGHRLWLGPQSTWSRGWPPPVAWESSGAESITINEGTLRLSMPDAGDGWPRLMRVYRWEGAKLRCGAELTGGTRPAQIIQIIQVPSTARVEAATVSIPEAPQGYVLLPAGGVPQRAAEFTAPPHVTRDERSVTLRHVGLVRKLGFRPQPLVARSGAQAFRVSRGAQRGAVATEPDGGFLTQVYLGGDEPFIELEQLSPTYVSAPTVSFEMVLEGLK